MPVSNLIWADSSGAIGYKAVGPDPDAGPAAARTCRSPAGSAEFEWDDAVPYEEMPEATDPDAGFLVTANNRIAGDEFPHHLTSDYLDGFRAMRIEQLIEETEEHDLDELPPDADRPALDPRRRGGAPPRRLCRTPAASARSPRSSG